MSNIAWNSFVINHKKTVGFVAFVSATLPQGASFDKNKKKLPTPYKLFKEWCNKTLKDDWSSQRLKGGFIVCVSSQNDAELICSAFKVLTPPQSTPACATTYRIGYSDSGYGALAKILGYVL